MSSEVLEPDPRDLELANYLVGDVDAATQRRIEERLASDADYRKRLESLKGTWALLDSLPSVAVADDAFTRSTVELAAVEAVEEATGRRSRRLSAAYWLVTASVVVLAAVAGYVFVLLAATSSDRQLIRDLAVIERVDIYRHLESFEYVLALDQSGLFVEDVAGASGPSELPSKSPGSLSHDLTDRAEGLSRAEAWKRVARLSPTEKEELLAREERFRRLPAAEQQRLRKLHVALLQHADSERLLRLTTAHDEWLRGLTSSQRAELAAVPLERRVEAIRRLMDQSVREQSLSPEDKATLLAWAESLAQRHEAELRSSLPPQFDWRLRTPGDEGMKRRLLIGVLLERIRGGASAIPTQEDLTELERRLSPAARQSLVRARESNLVRSLVSQWSRELLDAQRRQWMRAGTDELMRFYREQLTDEQRQRLQEMPQSQRQAELRYLYFGARFRDRFRPEGPPRRPDRPNDASEPTP